MFHRELIDMTEGLTHDLAKARNEIMTLKRNLENKQFIQSNQEFISPALDQKQLMQHRNQHQKARWRAWGLPKLFTIYVPHTIHQIHVWSVGTMHIHMNDNWWMHTQNPCFFIALGRRLVRTTETIAHWSSTWSKKMTPWLGCYMCQTPLSSNKS